MATTYISSGNGESGAQKKSKKEAIHQSVNGAIGAGENIMAAAHISRCSNK